MVDSETSASIAAVAVAAVAFCVALSQVIQQYASSGQLIRLCDSVVYGGSTGLPGRGKRVYQFGQFRFRVIYDVPVFSLPPKRSDLVWNALPVSTNSSGVDVDQNEQRLARLSPSPRVGEASWVSFCRKAKSPCHDRFLVTLVKADADRCPPDLPNVPVPVSLRDVAIMAFAMGLDCIEASFARKTISMQGPPGSLGSSNHPVLGTLIHFISQRAATMPPRPPPWKNWVARLYGLVSVGLDVLPQGSKRGRMFYEMGDTLLQELRYMLLCEGELPEGLTEVVKSQRRALQRRHEILDFAIDPDSHHKVIEVAADPATAAMSINKGNLSNDAMSWYWMSQMNVFQGAWATPWKQSVNAPFCIVAYTLVQGMLSMDNLLADQLVQVPHREMGQMFEHGAPFQSAPPFTVTFMVEQRRPGIGDPTWSYSGVFKARLPPLMTLVMANISSHEDERMILSNYGTIPPEAINRGIMKLDYWLTCAAATSVVYNGTTKILRKIPAIVDFMLSHAITRYEAARELRVSRFKRLLEHMELSHAERVYVLVAILRTLMVASCIGVGQDTLPTLEILDNDLPVHFV